MTKSSGESGTGHNLGPHVVGIRVVVRRIVRGETGPTGGPAFTDLLGICESWGDGSLRIRSEDGTSTEIALADVVSGKPVPPRPSRFIRFTDTEVQNRSAALFRPVATEQVGDWLLRYSGGPTARPNSILTTGDPGVPVDEALERARRFYAAHDRTPIAQAVIGSPALAALEERGWVRLRPDEADVDVLLAGVARVSRHLSGVSTDEVEYTDTVTPGWLVGTDRDGDPAVAASLALEDATFASVSADGRQLARVRANLIDDWALAADLVVQPGHRRRGLGRTMMAAVTDWAAERGASVMLLQVVGDNAAAQQLYASLGFEVHHTYRHLVPPG